MKERERPSRVTMFAIVFVAACFGFVGSDLFRGRAVDWTSHAISALGMGIFAGLVTPYLPGGRR